MLRQLRSELPRPDAILAFSPHWMASEATLGADAHPETIYDFWGFDHALYEMTYPVAGKPELAQRVAELMGAAGWAVGMDQHRGLDHGVWVPLRFLFPEADVPVVPLAMPWPLDAAGAYRLGRTLAPLTEENVLLVGTGSLTHNLPDWRAGHGINAPAEPYVLEFSDWIRKAVAHGGIEALLDYRHQAPHAVRAHPTDEHLLPLFWAAGAAGSGAHAEYRAGGVHYATLSMDACLFQ